MKCSSFPVASSKILYLSFDCLNMVYLSEFCFVFFFFLGYLMCLVVLSFLGSVNFGKFLAIIFSDIFSASFFPSDIPVMCMCYTFWNCPTVFGYSVYFILFFSLHLSLQSVCWPIFQLTASFSGCVKSDEPREGVLHSFCSAVGF